MARKLTRWVGIAAITGAILVAAPWMRDPETKALDAPNAAEFPGSYAQLGSGHVRYLLEGPEGGEIVMLVGGLTTSMEFFDKAAAFLNGAGYRTLQFDTYGRGGSARPADGMYDRQMFVDQIDRLLADIGIEEPIHVVGQSLGGGISSAWTAANPDRVRSLSIHASAGYVPELPATAGIIDIPVLGDYVWWWIGNGFIDGDLAKYFPDPSKHEAELASLAPQFDKAEQYKGYRKAVLRTIRNFDAHDMQEVYKRLDADKTPIQMIWGELDGVIPATTADKLIEWVSGTPELVVLDGIGHMPLLQAPDATHELVLSHIKEN